MHVVYKALCTILFLIQNDYPCLSNPVKGMPTTGAQNFNNLNTFFLLVSSLLNNSMGYEVSHTWHSFNQPVQN